MTTVNSIWRRLVAWLMPVDGNRLLREAERTLIGGQQVLLFGRMLSNKEVAALKAAYERNVGPWVKS